MDGTTNIITNADLVKSVRDTAILADLSISMWSGVKTDKKRLQELKDKYGATGDIGKLIINQLAGADAQLKAVHAACTAVRTYYYQATLPWHGNPNADRRSGVRLVPNLIFEDPFLKTLSQLRAAAMQTLEEFLAVYETQLVPQAKANLGGMSDHIYPTTAEVRAKFNIVVDFEPIPDNANIGVVGMRPEMIERLSAIMAQRHQAMVDGANHAMWENVSERVGHLCGRLRALQGDDDAAEGTSSTRFHASAVEHVRELLTYLPGWNVAGDPRVGEVVNDIKTMLEQVDAEKIKKNQQLRDETLNQAQSVMDKLNSWGV